MSVPKPLKKEDSQNVFTSCSNETFERVIDVEVLRGAVEWLIEQIANSSNDLFLEWCKELEGSDGSRYHEWLVKRAFGEVLK